MMRQNRLLPESIERLHFSLSEQVPVQVMAHHYAMPGSVPWFDMHYELELGIVLCGRMRRLYPHNRQLCTTGDLWCCGMWEPHGYEILESPCAVVVLVIWPPMLANLHFAEAPGVAWMSPFTLPPAHRPAAPASRRDAIVALGHRLAGYAGSQNPLHAVQVRLLLLEVLLQLWDERWDRQGSTQGQSPEILHRLSSAIDLVFQSHDLVTTRAAADACAMSDDQFSRHFQAMMGISFAKFALRHRIRGAAEELAGTDHPVKVVASRWGFTDESHLHRLFLTHYGCSPAGYRKRLHA